MKKQLYFFIAGLITIVSCQQSTHNQLATENEVPFNQEAETEAIMKVIDNETNCFFDGNYEGWAKNWSHQNYAMQAWNHSDGSSNAAIGWEEINSQGKDWIEKYYKNGDSIIHPDYQRKKPIVKFFNEKSAYLNWEQFNADADKKYYRISREIRIMEKEPDGWKIVNVSAFWDIKHKVNADSLELE